MKMTRGLLTFKRAKRNAVIRIPIYGLTGILYLIIVFLCSCKVVHPPFTNTHHTENSNPYNIARKIQGVYELIPHEDASNSRILVFSPIIRSVENTSYLLVINAVLIERDEFFDKSSVRQWIALSIKDKAIHYPDGRLYGRFLNDDYTKVWIRDYSSDTDNEHTWESHYTKIK